MTIDKGDLILQRLERLRADVDDLKALGAEMHQGLTTLQVHLAAVRLEQPLVGDRVVSLDAARRQGKRRTEPTDDHGEDD